MPRVIISSLMVVPARAMRTSVSNLPRGAKGCVGGAIAACHCEEGLPSATKGWNEEDMPLVTKGALKRPCRVSPREVRRTCHPEGVSTPCGCEGHARRVSTGDICLPAPTGGGVEESTHAREVEAGCTRREAPAVVPADRERQ